MVTAVEPDAVAPPDGRAGRSPVLQVVRAYVTLTKPRIIELLLVTTLPSMVLAARGMPSIGLVAATLGGGALAAGSAHAFNQVLERDIDAVMHRTRARPLATHQVSATAATVFAVVLLALSATVLLVWVNPLTAALTVAANAFYVLVYTVLLKRRTWQNIVWGGAAGCMPTLIGWAAVTGGLAWPPVLMFAIVFCWTPAHYWPLAMRFREDYARAGVPMLPVVASDVSVARQVLGYTIATVAATLALWPVGDLGLLYGAAAVLAGGWFALEATRLLTAARRGGVGERPMRVFHASITYLTVVFVALAADVLLLG
jgi:protoheme IX farnesyltransferase